MKNYRVSFDGDEVIVEYSFRFVGRIWRLIIGSVADRQARRAAQAGPCISCGAPAPPGGLCPACLNRAADAEAAHYRFFRTGWT